jgi:hypothetical protein
MILFGFVALNFLGQRSCVCTLLVMVKSSRKLLYASRNGLAHLQGLSPSIAEDQKPAILAQFTAQSLGISLEFLPLRLEGVSSALEIQACGWEDSIASAMEDRETHR